MKYASICVQYLGVCLCMVLSMHSADAQTSFNITRIVNNWPTIEVYTQAYCNGTPVYPGSMSDYVLKEDGIEIGQFTIWCPDPSIKCDISVALVFDASGSMSGAGQQGAIAAGNAFVDLMDGVVDEAAVIWFASKVDVQQGMTVNKMMLHNAVNSVPANGSTAVWDGTYVGLQEVILSGNNPCRAVIVLTDGNDNSSSHTPKDIVSLATRHRIRIYTIGLGSVTPSQLEEIAQQTGGKYYQAPSAGQLVGIYEEIHDIMSTNAYNECMMTYHGVCQDGAERTVEVTLKDICNTSLTDTETYRAPRDTSTFSDIYFSLGNATSYDGGDAFLPLTLDGASYMPGYIYGAKITVNYNSTDIVATSFATPPGSYLEGMPVTVSHYTGKSIIEFDGAIWISGPGLMGNLVFQPRQKPADSSVYTINLASWEFYAGCLRPILSDGVVTVYTSDNPFIASNGGTIICEGDSVQLTVSEVYDEYLWPNGETTQSIWATIPGTYSVRTRNGTGDWLLSNTVTLTMGASPSPVITLHGDSTFCQGDYAVCSVAGNWKAILWSTGDTTDQILVYDEGQYTVRVQNEYGCWGESQPIQITITGVRPKIDGPRVLCDNQNAMYSVEDFPGCQYEWSSDAALIQSGQGTTTVSVLWYKRTGTLQVKVYDPVVQCYAVDTFTIAQVYIQPVLHAKYSNVICPGDSVWIGMDARYDSYLWSTGETTDSIQVSQSGTYYCYVENGPCSGYSDTITLYAMGALSIAISGKSTVCPHAVETYSVPVYNGITYTCDAIGGTVQSHGANPVVEWGESGNGRLIVTYSNGTCSDTVRLDIHIRNTVSPGVAIYGNPVFCEGDSVLLRADDGFVGYNWNTGEQTQSIYVKTTWKYFYTVLDSNGCTVTSDSMNIVAVQKPVKPVVELHNDTLVCTTTAQHYQWYRNGQEIAQATSYRYLPNENGTYTVRIYELLGCETESDPMTITSVRETPAGIVHAMSIAPNPNTGAFQLSMEFAVPTAFTVRIVNVAGQTVYTDRIARPVVEYHKAIALDQAVPGTYFLTVESAHAFESRKILIK